MKKEVKEFLDESNKIEGVYDEDSLQQAIYAWEYLIKQSTLSIQVILRTHKILMLHQRIYPYERGYFRKVPVWIGGREGIPFERIREEISHWLMNVEDIIKNGKKESNIFLERIMKEHHIEYERIHPFIDGNGRTGRMFMNWERLKLKLPLLIIHEGEEQMKYYKWFNKK